MVRGRRLAEWDRAAAVLAMLFNTHRDPKETDAATPYTFHPYRRPPEKKSEPIVRMTLREVHEQLFGGRPMPVGKQ